MRYLLITFILITPFFVSAQDDSDDGEEYIEKYNEYSGLKLDGMMGAQMGIHPANFNTIIYSLGAYPRYAFVAPRDWFSITAGMPIQLGFDLLSNGSSTFLSFTSDVPIAVDVNLGSQSTPDGEYYVGAFAGAGIDYNLSYFLYNNQKLVSHSFGPMVHGGLRWLYRERPVGFRVSYLWGLVNNVEEDPAIIYEGKTYPTFISFNITYGIL